MRRTALLFACLACLAVTTPAGADDPKPVPQGGTAAVPRNGTHRSGRWKYRVAVTSEGSKSQGSHGELFFDCAALPAGADAYRTPWGTMHWVEPTLPWAWFGWTRSDGADPVERRVLDAPPHAGDPEPVVLATQLREGEAPAEGGKVEAWALEQLGQIEGGATDRGEKQFRLTDQAVTVEDTKLYGRMAVRLAPPVESDALTVRIDGTTPAGVTLARKDGATRVVRHVLKDHLGNERALVFVFQVECAAPDWPKPVVVGAAAADKTIVVKGAARVLVVLPGDADSGLVWKLRAVEGGAVSALGEAQFTPDLEAAGPGRSGTFELLFRVVTKGKSTLVLDLLRPWQTDVPPTRTFRVVLDVLSAP